MEANLSAQTATPPTHADHCEWAGITRVVSGELFLPRGKKRIAADHEPTCPQSAKLCKNSIDVILGAGVKV